MLRIGHRQLVAGPVATRSLLLRDDGQGLIEYALIASLIALVVIASLRLTGTNLLSLLNKVSGDV